MDIFDDRDDDAPASADWRSKPTDFAADMAKVKRDFENPLSLSAWVCSPCLFVSFAARERALDRQARRDPSRF